MKGPLMFGETPEFCAQLVQARHNALSRQRPRERPPERALSPVMTDDAPAECLWSPKESDAESVILQPDPPKRVEGPLNPVPLAWRVRQTRIVTAIQKSHGLKRWVLLRLAGVRGFLRDRIWRSR